MNEQKLAWITGANGLIGSYLLAAAPQLAPGWRVRGVARADFDLADVRGMVQALERERPELVIHCAAVTTVAAAQQDPARAWLVNLEATRVLAERVGRLVFFSTDLVFDGRKGNYAEGDVANPLSIYGETKLAAEGVVLRGAGHLVVRTTINGGKSASGTRAFNEQLRQALRGAGAGMKLFTDEFRCPIAAVETARAVWELVGRGATGLYHVAGAERLSRWEIGELLRPRWPEVTARLEAGQAKDFPGPPRALDVSLNIGKVQGVLSRPLPGLRAWLAANPQVDF